MTSKSPDSVHCAHYASKYLPLTENWIYRIIINHRQYKPIFLSRKKENLSLFPIPSLYSLDDFSKTRQYLEILLFRIFGYFNFFKNVCEDNEIKILHVHFGYHGVKSVGLKRKLKIPMVCSFYGDDVFAHPHTGNNKQKYTLLFKALDRALVLGPHMKSELINLGCPENKIFIHHLGIDLDKIRFSQRTVDPGNKIRFLIASSFVEKKGIDLAIKALSKFKDKHDFSLDIIGDGPLKSELLKTIEVSGIADRIKLHGYKPYDYFIAIAYECDVFIQASLTTRNNNKEGTPMAIVDAMATGMAVISTKHSDIPEIVIDGQTGYLADEGSLISLENCLEKLFNDTRVIEVFSVNGRKRAEQEFNAKTQTLKLEEYYTQLIHQNITANR